MSGAELDPWEEGGLLASGDDAAAAAAERGLFGWARLHRVVCIPTRLYSGFQYVGCHSFRGDDYRKQVFNVAGVSFAEVTIRAPMGGVGDLRQRPHVA